VHQLLVYKLATQLSKAAAINDIESNFTRAPVTMETESYDVRHRITSFYEQTADRSSCEISRLPCTTKPSTIIYAQHDNQKTSARSNTSGELSLSYYLYYPILPVIPKCFLYSLNTINTFFSPRAMICADRQILL
jgi:hypothetical protein